MGPHGSSRRQQRQRRWSVSIVLFVLGLLAAGCVMGAAAVAPGPIVPGTVSVLGTWSGAELDAFRRVVAPFEAATGISVAYERTDDLSGEIDRRVAAGEPPDLAGLTGPAHLERLAREGVLEDLGVLAELDAYRRETAPAFVHLGMVDDRLVGAFLKATLKGLVWYGRQAAHLGEPDDFPDLVRTAARFSTDGTRPWCVGLESAAAPGWPGTDLIENILLRQSGTRIWDAWVAGALPWTAPEMRAAFVSYLDVVAPDAVAGGSYGALTTDALAAGDGLFQDPPKCLYTPGASFHPALFAAQGKLAGRDYDFFPMPAFDDDHQDAVEVGGDLFGLFTDRPAAVSLLAWLTSADAQRSWASTGGALSANTRVTDYPNGVTQREAAILTGAQQVRFDASDQMPAGIESAFRRAVLDVTAAPHDLDAVLARLEALSAPSGRGPHR